MLFSIKKSYFFYYKNVITSSKKNSNRFFEKQNQYFHISGIKIFNDKNEDISSSCTFTSTSSLDGFPASIIKTVLTDNDPSTIMHTKNIGSEYMVIEFAKVS